MAFRADPERCAIRRLLREMARNGGGGHFKAATSRVMSPGGSGGRKWATSHGEGDERLWLAFREGRIRVH
jgi:hypothetical protein